MCQASIIRDDVGKKLYFAGKMEPTIATRAMVLRPSFSGRGTSHQPLASLVTPHHPGYNLVKSKEMTSESFPPGWKSDL